MQGVTVRGQFPKTKNELKRAVAEEPERVRVIASSIFGGEHDGRITTLPKGKEANVAGPDYLSNRRWYATIGWKGEKLTCR